MDGFPVRLYFEDEAPTIGAGWRTVFADDDNEITRLSDSLGRVAHIPTKLFDSLVDSTEAMLDRFQS